MGEHTPHSCVACPGSHLALWEERLTGSARADLDKVLDTVKLAWGIGLMWFNVATDTFFPLTWASPPSADSLSSLHFLPPPCIPASGVSLLRPQRLWGPHSSLPLSGPSAC